MKEVKRALSKFSIATPRHRDIEPTGGFAWWWSRQTLVHEVVVLLTAGERLIELKKTLHEFPIDLLRQQLSLLGVQSN